MKINSLSQFNKALENAGSGFRLYKAKGYFYYLSVNSKSNLTQEPPSIYMYAFVHGSSEFWQGELNAVLNFEKEQENEDYRN